MSLNEHNKPYMCAALFHVGLLQHTQVQLFCTVDVYLYNTSSDSAIMFSVKLLVWPWTKGCRPGLSLDPPLDICHFSCLFGLLSDNKHYCDLHWVNRVLHALLSYWHFRVSLVFIAFDSRYVLCARKCHKTWPLASEGMRDSSLEFAAIWLRFSNSTRRKRAPVVICVLAS